MTLRTVTAIMILTMSAGAALGGAGTPQVTTTGMTADGSYMTMSSGRSYTTSVLDRISLDSFGRYIVAGRFPPTLDIVELTDEQKASIDKVLAEAKKGRTGFYKEWRQSMKANRSKVNTPVKYDWKEYQAQQKELSDKYVTRVMDLLTAEQKKLLEQIFAMGEEKRAEVTKINEEALKARNKVTEKYEGRLAKLVSPEVLKELKTEMTPTRKSSGPSSIKTIHLGKNGQQVQFGVGP